MTVNMKFSDCVPYLHLTSSKYHSDLENRTACSLDNCDTIGKIQNIKQTKKKNHLEQDKNSTEVHASSQNNMKMQVSIQME